MPNLSALGSTINEWAAVSGTLLASILAGRVNDCNGLERKRVVIGTTDDGVCEIGEGLGYFAEDQRAGAAAKGGAEQC